MLPRLTLVLGGAASGKSAWAENLLLGTDLDLLYLATSRVLDPEIKSKVNEHKSRRNDRWTTIEADLDPASALRGLDESKGVLLDCATMWLSNQMMEDADIVAAQGTLLNGLSETRARVVVVSNEVGHGIVPDNSLARRFREAQGRLNIALAAQSDVTVFVTAGLPLLLKGRLP